ncbi:MAG: transporter substrate-binding domain-containing protein [Oscillibacter sp.]|nr:transporter substrate-binding domain-containing protein [Oscillibacter sp.]
MVLSLAACGAKKEEAPAPAPEETPAEEIAALTTVTEGKLTVATSPDFAPYEFYALAADGTPTLAGFDVALAQYIADYLGLELEIIPMDFDGVLAEIANGSVDLGLAGLSPDPARMDAMDFSDLYYMGGQSFVCVQSNKDLFPTLEDANKAEYQIGAQTGSIQADLANENTPDADVVLLTKVTDIIAELINGKLDGAFIETAVAETYAKNYPELYVALDVPYDMEGSAAGVNKGNEALLAGVNEAIAATLAYGSMDTFIATANDLASGDIYEGLLEE